MWAVALCGLIRCATIAVGLVSPSTITWVDGPHVPTLVCPARGTSSCDLAFPRADDPCEGLAVDIAWRGPRLAASAARAPITAVSLSRPGSTTLTFTPGAWSWRYEAASASTGVLDLSVSDARGCVARVRVVS